MKRATKWQKVLSKAFLCAFGAECSMLILAPPAQAAVSCSPGGVEALNVPGVSVVTATVVAASGAMPAYCDVIGQLNTTGESAPSGSAGFELRLPENWNKKFLFLGVGGFAGQDFPSSANPADLSVALSKGYVTMVTDEGHVASQTTDASWALLAPGKPAKAKLIDYFYRATHEVTVAGKGLVQGFYGAQAIEEAYFDGCSNGGRQALVEATQFPNDYNGIIAGDPFLDTRYMINGARLQKQQLTAETYIPATLLPMIDAAVNASCGVVDGVDDGLIQNPAACGFDPYSLVCNADRTSACLTAGQADTLNAYLTAVRTPTGGLAYPGYAVSNLATPSSGPLTLGGADAWTTGLVPPESFTAPEPWGNDGYSPAPLGYQFSDHILKYIVSRDPNYNIRDFPVSPDGFVEFEALHQYDTRTAMAGATDPNSYSQFIASGRKLIIYHGFSDPTLTPFSSINLYQQLGQNAGGIENLQRSVRLFMVPGMQHCTGGPGPNVFETLTPLESWVEQGVAPESIVAAHHVNDDPAQAVDRTMPLCPYPTTASYSGAGDVANGANWSCVPNQHLLEVGPNGAQAGANGR